MSDIFLRRRHRPDERSIQDKSDALQQLLFSARDPGPTPQELHSTIQHFYPKKRAAVDLLGTAHIPQQYRAHDSNSQAESGIAKYFHRKATKPGFGDGVFRIGNDLGKQLLRTCNQATDRTAPITLLGNGPAKCGQSQANAKGSQSTA